MLTLLSGGTGTPKLLQGLTELVPESEISVIVNTGEDLEVSGLRVSPDLDAVTYTLAGIIDNEKWYGIKGEKFSGHKMLEKLGHEEILRIGDRDRAVQLFRTIRLQKGDTLSEATHKICKNLGIKAHVIPTSNDRIRTRIITREEEMTFHEFWIERRGDVEVKDVKFLGSDEACPAPGVIEAIEQSDEVIIGPSNPITSLGPILAVKKIQSSLKENKDKVIVVSPVLGNAPVSGPAGILMKGLNHEVTPLGVAKIYKKFAKKFVLHDEDERMKSNIEKLGIEVMITDILIPDHESRIDLARKILEHTKYF